MSGLEERLERLVDVNRCPECRERVLTWRWLGIKGEQMGWYDTFVHEPDRTVFFYEEGDIYKENRTDGTLQQSTLTYGDINMIECTECHKCFGRETDIYMSVMSHARQSKITGYTNKRLRDD